MNEPLTQRQSQDEVRAPQRKGKQKTRSRSEAILIRPAVGKPFAEVLGCICSKVSGTLSDSVAVCCAEPKSMVELRGMDDLTAVEEVNQCNQSTRVFVSKSNSRRQKMATVILTMGKAEALLAKSHLKYHWIICRIRSKIVVSRCFRCLGFGHLAAMYAVPNRNKLCLVWKRGSPGCFLIPHVVSFMLQVAQIPRSLILSQVLVASGFIE